MTLRRAGTLLFLALLVVGVCGAQWTSVLPPAIEWGHRMGQFDPEPEHILDSAFRADTLEWVVSVDLMYMAKIVGAVEHDSGAIVVKVSSPCQTDSVSVRAIWGIKCRLDASPQIHSHPSGRCNPSRIDLLNQWANRREFDVIYCGEGASYFYFLVFNPYEIAMRHAFGQPPFPPIK